MNSESGYANAVKRHLDANIAFRADRLQSNNMRAASNEKQSSKEYLKSIGKWSVGGAFAGGGTGATIGLVGNVAKFPFKKIRAFPFGMYSTTIGATLGALGFANLRARKGRKKYKHISYDKKLSDMKYVRKELENISSPSYKRFVRQGYGQQLADNA